MTLPRLTSFTLGLRGIRNLPPLASLPTLIVLDISGCSHGVTNLQPLAACTRLTKLVASTDMHAPTPHLPSLRHLEAGWPYASADVARALEAGDVAAASGVVVGPNAAAAGGAGLEAAQAAAPGAFAAAGPSAPLTSLGFLARQHPELRHLRLSWVPNVQNLEAITRLTDLETLELDFYQEPFWRNPPLSEVLAAILTRLPKLGSLSLQCNRNDYDVGSLAVISSLTSLTVDRQWTLVNIAAWRGSPLARRCACLACLACLHAAVFWHVSVCVLWLSAWYKLHMSLARGMATDARAQPTPSCHVPGPTLTAHSALFQRNVGLKCMPDLDGRLPEAGHSTPHHQHVSFQGAADRESRLIHIMFTFISHTCGCSTCLAPLPSYSFLS